MSALGQRWQRLAPFATIAMAVLIVAALAANAVLILTLPASLPSYDALSASGLAPFVPFVATGAIAVLLATRRPGNPVGWLLGALVIFFCYSGISQAYLYHSLYASDVPRALLLPIVLSAAAVSLPTFFTLMLLVFPDGHLPSPRWRPVAWLLAIATVVSGIATVLDPAAVGDGHRLVSNPLGHIANPDLLNAVNNALGLVALALAALALVSMIVRYRRAGAELREQLKWFGLGAVIAAAGVAVASATATSSAWATAAPLIASTIGFSGLPICIGIAVLKYRLYDIDVVISRALVYGSLAALITAVYVGIVVGIGSVVGSGGKPNLVLSIFATAVVAVGFQAVRDRLQRLANRLVYGKRATPYEVLSEFSERVAETYAGEEVLPRMARILADGTAAERAEVWLRVGDRLHPAAAWPETEDGAVTLAVTRQILPDIPDVDRAVAVLHQGELLGALSVSKRRGESLTPIEGKLLEDLAHQAGLVLKNVGLTADLQRRLEDLRGSRQRLVAAQDEERRRLERNLHDGAQQNLVAIKVKIGLAEMMIAKDPRKTKDLITDLKADTDEALETLRDLARGIYPPLLAEQGLAAALESQARKATLPVTVAGDDVGRYQQEIESAVYFCVLEGLQNVQKYANASSAVVRLAELQGHLQFEVSDDGRGFDESSAVRGAGLTNMDDRLAALGGTLTITSEVGRFIGDGPGNRSHWRVAMQAGRLEMSDHYADRHVPQSATRQFRVSPVRGAAAGLAIAVAELILSGGTALAAVGDITEYTVPTPYTVPSAIAAGPDGNLWFIERQANKVGNVTTSGSFTEYLIPTANIGSAAIAAGPDGNLWFTESAPNKVAKVTTSGVFTEYPVPTASSSLGGIAAGPDGNLWFTESAANKVAKVTTSGVFTEYPAPASGGLGGIAAGPDGNLWVLEPNNVAKVTTSGVFTEYPIPTAGSVPESITAGPDRNLWFTEGAASNVAKVTTVGVVTEYPIPRGLTSDSIAAGSDGNLWFTESSNDSVAKLTTSGAYTQYQVPTVNGLSTGLGGIAAGPDGNVWFTAGAPSKNSVNKIEAGRFITQEGTNDVTDNVWVPLACNVTLTPGPVPQQAPAHIAMVLTATRPDSVDPGQVFDLTNTFATLVLPPPAQRVPAAIYAPDNWKGVVTDFEINATGATASFTPGSSTPTQFNEVQALQPPNSDAPTPSDPLVAPNLSFGPIPTPGGTDPNFTVPVSGPVPGTGGNLGTPDLLHVFPFTTTGAVGTHIALAVGDPSRHIQIVPTTTGQNEVYAADAQVYFHETKVPLPQYVGPQPMTCGLDTYPVGTGDNNAVPVPSPGFCTIRPTVRDPWGSPPGCFTSDDATIAPASARPGIAIPVVNPAPRAESAVSKSQYRLANSDGAKWTDMDATNLSLLDSPSFSRSTLLTANSDLWTANAGFNQDIGIFVSDNGGADTLVAWKESGGFAGTYSPNAAYVQYVYPEVAGHTYVFKLKWKTNHSGTSTIAAGAGGSASFSPTSLTSEVLPSVPNFAVSTAQYTLANSNGTTWTDLDAANLSTTLTPVANSTAVLGANSDLWTANAGFNQDIGIFVSDNGGADTLVGWKEAGGFAGTFSPNAAAVKATFAMTGGHSYLFKLKWKTNHSGTSTIAAGAGGPAPFSPTSLFAQAIAAGTNPFDAVSTSQYTLTHSDGTNWQPIDAALNVTVAPASSSYTFLSANTDLWTDSAGYNQDIGIFVSDNGSIDQLLAWKESGGFAGTYSPNAAFVQATYPVHIGHTYVFKLKWKTNHGAVGPNLYTIYAGAGSAPTFSPTRLMVEVTN